MIIMDTGNRGLDSNSNDSMEANTEGVPWKYSDLFLYNMTYSDRKYARVPREFLRSWELYRRWKHEKGYLASRNWGKLEQQHC